MEARRLSGGSVVNQVQRELNGLGQITKEYQSHSGVVNTSTTPKVQYTYSEMPGGANHSRPTSVVYPDGFTVTSNYATGLPNTISRLSSLANGSTTLEGYSYLGVGTVVARSHPESGVDLTYIATGTGDGGDQYVGLDRFARVVDQRWKNGSGTDLDRFSYVYDRDSNRTAKNNLVTTGLNETYTYDGLNQLASFQRGTHQQTWDPDALGNFDGVNTDGTNQSRTHNKQNQLTVAGSGTLTYDANGNLTTDETGRTFTYDAWNRPVKVNGTTRYADDALGRRIKEGSTELYYSKDWQVLEERNSSNTPVARSVWSPVYVDAMVMRDRDADGNGSLEERLYVLADANYNVTALVNTSGSVVERYLYDPYGRFDVKDASWGTRASSSYAWVYLHQGGRWDATEAMYSFRHRDYSPTLMRWASVDSLGFKAKDANLYRYEADDPGGTTDSAGLLAHDTVNETCQRDPELCIWLAETTGGISAEALALAKAALAAGAGAATVLAPVAPAVAEKCVVIHNEIVRDVGNLSDEIGDILDRVTKPKPETKPKTDPWPDRPPWPIDRDPGPEELCDEMYRIGTKACAFLHRDDPEGYEECMREKELEWHHCLEQARVPPHPDGPPDVPNPGIRP